MNGEITEFETWFVNRQRANGNPTPTPLINVERGILQTYVQFLQVRETKP